MKTRRHLHLPTFEELELDLSPMIDLVFLLLIFFMTSSTLITFLKDRRVDLPVADEARVPLVVTARFIVNVYEDGSIGDEHGRALTPPDLTRRLRADRARLPSLRLHVRPDRRVAHAAVHRVLTAARDAGVTDVVFGAYTSDR